MHKLVITPSAKNSLKKLPLKTREKLIKAVKILETDIYAGKNSPAYCIFYIRFISNTTIRNTAPCIQLIAKTNL